MSQQNTYPPVAPPAHQPMPPAPPAKKPRNTLGLVAMIVAIVGAVFAVIPGAAIIGWILLPVAFILSIVSFFMPRKGKGMSTAGLVISVVGTIIGVIAFFLALGTAVHDAVNDSLGGETSVVQPVEEDAAADADAAPSEGTRENPFALGSVLSNEDWQFTVNSVTFGATDAVMAENQFNEVPEAGSEYILVNVTATYVGASSKAPALIQTAFVTAEGVTVNTYDSLAVVPDSFNSLTELYNGGSISGNIAFVVPSATAQDGVISVRLSLLGDPVFVAVR